VNTREIDDNLESTDIDNFYNSALQDQLAFRKCLREKITKNPDALRGIVRIHYVLPKASSKCRSFFPGRISTQSRKIQLGDSEQKVEHSIWEIIVDVDLAVMPQTGFVPRSLCDEISAAFFARTCKVEGKRLYRKDSDERKRTTKEKEKKSTVILSIDDAVAKIESMQDFPDKWEESYTLKHIDAYMAKHKISQKGRKKKSEKANQIAKATSGQRARKAKRARMETKVVVTPTSKEDNTETTGGIKRRRLQTYKNEESEDEEESKDEEDGNEEDEEEYKEVTIQKAKKTISVAKLSSTSVAKNASVVLPKITQTRDPGPPFPFPIPIADLNTPPSTPIMEPMFCIECGSPISNVSKFCNTCGKPQ